MLISEKRWHNSLFEELNTREDENWLWISEKSEFTLNRITNFNPVKIFIPHWSYIIPKKIYDKFECIVFHMTDLPYGRGGSPLQNLIIRGHKETVISAFKVQEGLDTGDIYMKQPLSLYGTAEEIFIRSVKIIEKMITNIIEDDLQPAPQEGKTIEFMRREPKDGDISKLESIEEIYDYIRMLDADGYPHAFIEVGNFRLEFSRASIKFDRKLSADVRISEK